jgi:hypothetical protein
MNCKIIFWTAGLVLCGCGALCWADRPSAIDEKADHLGAAFPPLVSQVATWPPEGVLAGPGRVPVEEYRDQANQSVAWLERVVQATMRPVPDEAFCKSLILLKGGPETADVVRAQWTKDGYAFQVSQSLAVMTIRVIPPAGTDLGQTAEKKRQYAAGLALRVFADTDTRAGLDAEGNPMTVSVGGLAGKIVDYSFQPTKTRELKDAVVGTAVTMQDMGVRPPESGEEINAENQVDNANWDRSSSSWSYWWRHVNWWNDGKSVVFVILKCDAGAIQVDYVSPELNRWFRTWNARPATPKPG